MVIDFHTHLFPDKIAGRAIEKLTEGIFRTQGAHVLPPQTDGTRTGLLSSMEKSGVDLSVILPIATSPTQHTTINTFAKEITDNKKIISFGSIHPMQEDWEEALEHIAELKLPGIKMHPEFQDFYVDEPIILDIVKKCEKLNLLVLFHSGADMGYHPPVHCTPQRLRTVLDKTGCTNIIAAHLGAFLMWEDVDKYLIGTSVMMDTSMTNSFLDKEKCTDMIKRHGADKVLFGSDSPWQGQRAALDYLLSLNISDEEKELITHKNAERLLSL